MKEIQETPKSKSFGDKKDVFQGAEYDSGLSSLPPGAKQLHLRLGQSVEVFRGKWSLTDDPRELAFYLPVEARSVVQLIVEKNGLTRSYFIKAIGVGDTVGGVVERRWLNSAGYDPIDAAGEARIQDAVRARPFVISVN